MGGVFFLFWVEVFVVVWFGLVVWGVLFVGWVFLFGVFGVGVCVTFFNPSRSLYVISFKHTKDFKK